MKTSVSASEYPDAVRRARLAWIAQVLREAMRFARKVKP